MANNVAAHQALAFHHASNITQDVWGALLENEAAANVILPFALKARDLPPGDSHNLWVALYDERENVKLVLSCTRGPVDDYPIFVVPSKSFAQTIQQGLNDESLDHALLPLVQCLLNHVPPQRIFSIFSVARVAERFASVFMNEPRALAANDVEAPRTLYDATFTFCTWETLRPPPGPLEDSEKITIALDRANESDLEQVKDLCMAFSETSPPYVLDDPRARLEATSMITHGQAWAHVIQKTGRAPEVACLVATTRESDNVTTVTKVYTATDYRQLGCARRLLHRVCTHIFQTKAGKRVVLYVGNSDEMRPVRRLYHNVGFQGFTGPNYLAQPMEGMERWLEIGFFTGTPPGHW